MSGGLCARVVALQQGPLRALAFTPGGDLVAATARGEVRRYRDYDGDGVLAASVPETVVVVLSAETTATRDAGPPEEVAEGGLAVADDALYVALARGVVKRFPLRRALAEGPLGWNEGDVVARLPVSPRTAGAHFALPERWRAGRFEALPGRRPSGEVASTGARIRWIPDDASAPDETVFGGGKYGAPRDGEWSWRLGDSGEDPVRPTSVALSPVDGALYAASDNGGGPDGAIYRISLLGQ